MWLQPGKTVKSSTVLDIDTIFVLQDDVPNYSGKDAPVVVMSNGNYFRTPKYLWKQGREVLEHLQCYQAPDIGRATLRQWFSAILDSEQLLEDESEEEEETSKQEVKHGSRSGRGGAASGGDRGGH